MTARLRLSHHTVGIIVILAACAVFAVIYSGIFREPFAAATHTVTADFERAPQLRSGDKVRIQGRVEGSVASITSLPGSAAVRVRMDVSQSAGPIFADAHARLAFGTLLGGLFYIDLDRGTAASGPLGASIISLRNTSVQVELEDVTSIFQSGALTGLQTLPGELATALSNPDAPASALHTLSAVAPSAAVALRALRGQQPGTDLPTVVDAAANTVRALDLSNDDLRTLVAGAATTLAVTGRRAAEIRAAIDAGPSVTYDMTSTFARLNRTLDLARGLVDRLKPAAPAVAPTLTELEPTLISTNTLLDHAMPIVQMLPGTFGTLGGASQQLVPLVDGVKPALTQVDRTILPYLWRKDPGTGKSTTVMIGGFAAGFGGIAAQQDANGHFIRFPASIGLSSLYVPCTSSIVDPTAARVLACDTFQQALSNYLSYLPELGPLQGILARKARR